MENTFPNTTNNIHRIETFTFTKIVQIVEIQLFVIYVESRELIYGWSTYGLEFLASAAWLGSIYIIAWDSLLLHFRLVPRGLVIV